jgi:hypothetical protein
MYPGYMEVYVSRHLTNFPVISRIASLPVLSETSGFSIIREECSPIVGLLKSRWF